MVAKIYGIIGLVKSFLVFVAFYFGFLWYFCFAFCGVSQCYGSLSPYFVWLASIRASDLFVVFDT